MAEEDVEAILRASGRHWRFCRDCERWWFARISFCGRCLGELKRPDKEALIEFTSELLAFWNELTDMTKQGYTENEVAGLLSVQKRHAQEAVESEGQA